ncbi:MAG TPA: uracil-DNA glycosylase family protein [Flavisolibacter sp.]|jgi:hypothetical protein|nr:uracil-DNA glycosylase family protein [Flavisolibacter sp.]
MTWADHIIAYYKGLTPPQALPGGIEWLYPQQQPQVMEVVERFYKKYYSDTRERTLLLGINPGRFGAGVTGVNFTAAKQLTTYCGIAHPFKEQSELSAEFIYDMIHAYGGPEAFYQDFFIGSVCPLGFVQRGRNINYYDDKELLKTVEPFIIKSLETLLSYQADRSYCICIGREKNFRYLTRLNEAHNWFKTIVSVPHPRFIMQYKRKEKDSYILKYLDVLKKK